MTLTKSIICALLTMVAIIVVTFIAAFLMGYLIFNHFVGFTIALLTGGLISGIIGFIWLLYKLYIYWERKKHHKLLRGNGITKENGWL